MALNFKKMIGSQAMPQHTRGGQRTALAYQVFSWCPVGFIQTSLCTAISLALQALLSLVKVTVKINHHPLIEGFPFRRQPVGFWQTHQSGIAEWIWGWEQTDK